MASDMTAPSRVIRSANHRGTWPPCNGKSALPARRVINSYVPVGVCKSTNRPVHALYNGWRFGATREMSCGDNLLKRDERAFRGAGGCLMTAAYLAKLNAE